jgi:hypothetical protein
VIGSDPSNHSRTITIPFTIDHGLALPSTIQAMGAGATILSLLGLILLAASGELRASRRGARE